MSDEFDPSQSERPLSSKVEALAGFELTAADIACVLATDEKELQATYAHELDSGGIKANARVTENLQCRGARAEYCLNVLMGFRSTSTSRAKRSLSARPRNP